MFRIKHLKAPGKKCLIFNFQDVQTGRAGRIYSAPPSADRKLL